MRKRKRPKYLSEFVQTSSEAEDGDSIVASFNKKKKPKVAEEDGNSDQRETPEPDEVETEILVESTEGKCCVCDEYLIVNDDIKVSTGSSESSYADILNSIFNNKQDSITEYNFPRLRFASGNICLLCKSPIRDLDLLQNKIIGLKKVILKRASKKFGESSKKPNIKESTQAQGPETIQEVKSKLEIKEEAKSETKTKRVRRKARSTGSRETEEGLPDEARETPSEKETGFRPRREKVRSSMSEIERAKIKNLKSDLKFQVKKRDKTDVFIIEYLKEKKDNKYLVKWENRHESENSWESRNKIPCSVLQYYEEDLGRLGSPVPPPTVSRGKVNPSLPKPKPKLSHSDDNNKSKKKSSSSVKEVERGTEDDEEGEYIEDVESFELTAATIKKEDGIKENTSKPESSVDSVVIPEKPEDKKKESSPIKSRGSDVPPVDVENTVRKSKRDSKPKKYYIPDEEKNPIKSPKKKKLPKKSPQKEDKVYIIESLVDVKDGHYLVKWVNYPSSQNTWEPQSSIPKFILKFYSQDPSRLGMPAPDVS